jgi:ribosomal protein S27AE
MSLAYYNRFGIKRLPRKLKKRILGKKIKKSKLRKLLYTVRITYHKNGEAEIYPNEFCPHCGCTIMFSTGNRTLYPEWWEYYYCAKCGEIIGYIDNSPFVHALQCKENNYNPVF